MIKIHEIILNLSKKFKKGLYQEELRIADYITPTTLKFIPMDLKIIIILVLHVPSKT